MPFSLQVGEILGLWAAGSIAQRWGYKKTILGAHIMMIAVVSLSTSLASTNQDVCSVIDES